MMCSSCGKGSVSLEDIQRMENHAFNTLYGMTWDRSWKVIKSENDKDDIYKVVMRNRAEKTIVFTFKLPLETELQCWIKNEKGESADASDFR